MKTKLLALLFFISISSYAQVGIGTTTPNAKLEIKASNTTTPTNKDGILIPKINNFPTTNPTTLQDGMLVFITGAGTPTKGFYYWNNTTSSWIPVGGNSGVKKIDDLLDGKSDPNGSSVFLGSNAGLVDDGSDNRNVGIGYLALRINVTGNQNTAVGAYSLKNNRTGLLNTANGYFALSANNASYNTAIGAIALASNTTGSRNTAIGMTALGSNTTGSFNTAIGMQTLLKNTTGTHNTANGWASLFTNTTGSKNTATGANTLQINTTGSGNTANGYTALHANTLGIDNTATGMYALYSNTTGNNNTANGALALASNTTGIQNTATSRDALFKNISGNNNVANGYKSLYFNTIGNYNTGFGDYSLYINNVGNYNTSIGYYAGPASSTNLVNSTAIGSNTFSTASNQIRIGSNTITSIGGFTNWTNVSDKRFKKNIKENVKGLDFILRLKPVTYNLDIEKIEDYLKIPDSVRYGKKKELLKYRKIKLKEVQTGFIAQEVEQTAKDLGYDFSGVDKPKNEHDYYGLRYAEFVVPLVKGMQEQQEIIIDLKNENQTLKKELLKQKKRLDKIEKLLTKK